MARDEQTRTERGIFVLFVGIYLLLRTAVVLQSTRGE
jgi:hypothetical protein